MSNWNEVIMTKEGFKVGLYSFSVNEGLRYVGTTVIDSDNKLNYLIPTQLRNLLDNPYIYVNNDNEKVYIWLNELM